MPSLLRLQLITTAIFFYVGLLLVRTISSLQFCNDENVDFVFPKEDYKNPRAALVYPTVDKWLPKIENEFTMCFWAYVDKKLAGDRTLFSFVSYLTESPKWKGNEIVIEADFGTECTSVYVGGKYTGHDQLPPQDEWFHFCSTWKDNNVTIYINGEEKGSQPVDLRKDYKIDRNGMLVLGQDQDGYKDYYGDYTSGLVGRMTQFHAFGHAVTPAEVKDVMNCKLEGDAVSWATALFNFGGGIMLEKSEMTSCSNEKVCYEHRTISSYDVISNNIKPVNNHAIIRARLEQQIPKLTALTLCFWQYVKDPNTLTIAPISYIGSDNSQRIIYSIVKDKIYFTIGDKSKSFPNTIPPEKWSHTCVSWNGTNNGETKLYLDGQAKDPVNINPNYEIPDGGEVLVQQDQVAPLNEDNPTENFNYKMVGLNMYKNAFDDTKVNEEMACSGQNPGDVFCDDELKYELVY